MARCAETDTVCGHESVTDITRTDERCKPGDDRRHRASSAQCRDRSPRRAPSPDAPALGPLRRRPILAGIRRGVRGRQRTVARQPRGSVTVRRSSSPPSRVEQLGADVQARARTRRPPGRGRRAAARRARAPRAGRGPRPGPRRRPAPPPGTRGRSTGAPGACRSQLASRLVTTWASTAASPHARSAGVGVERHPGPRRPAQRDQPGQHRLDRVLGARRPVRRVERDPAAVEDRVQPAQLATAPPA